jgi:hypothetical protein
MKQKEIFVSVDIEADGRLVGINSLLSLGSVAFFVDEDGYKQIATFEANLEEYPNAVQDEKIMEWWKKFPEAWEKIRENTQPPEVVMQNYLKWLKALPGKVVFVGYPATYDFMFVFWYLKRFTGEEPFRWAGLCSKTYFMAVLKEKKWLSFSKNIPDKYKSNQPHDHTSLNDAIEQGQEFAAIYFENVIKEGE